MLFRSVFHIFSLAFVTHLLYFYLLLCPWVCWLSFLPCLPIELFSSFPGIPRPIYFTFTSCCAYGSIGCYSCHVGPLDFLPLFLGFHDPFTLLLPFVVPISPLGVILTMLAHRVFLSLFLGFHDPFTLLLHLLLHFSLIFPHCWAFFVQNEYQHQLNKYKLKHKKKKKDKKLNDSTW